MRNVKKEERETVIGTFKRRQVTQEGGGSVATAPS